MPSPRTEVLTLDGRRVEVQCTRRPGPVIVLVNGAGGPLDGWMRVWGPLTELGTVVAWNRPGIGASDSPHVDQTSAAVTRQLQAMLAALAIPGPYVLVGHSLGGLQALIDRLWPPQPHSEFVHARVSAAQLAGLPPLPPVPLAVVTGMRPALAWLTPRAQRAACGLNQNAMVQLSPLGFQISVLRSGHFPQLSEPTLVVEVIADLCRAAHSGHIA